MGWLGHYILDANKMAVPVDMMEWAVWFENATRTRQRMVAVENIGEDYVVSTVFLGLDHGFGDVVLVFETMIFEVSNWRDIWMDRCGTWQEAIDMHEHGVAHAQQLLRQLPVIIDQGTS
jgi:hypothetical protein